MQPFLQFIFILNFSFILLHEMDAIRNKEWQMFAGLKQLTEEKAYRLFTFLHLPIYAVLLYLLIRFFQTQQFLFYLMLDLFLIFHAIIHYTFRNNHLNGFISMFSKFIIYIPGWLAGVHLAIVTKFIF